MRILVKVDRAAAIRAGRDAYGAVEIQVHPADLTSAERELLVTFTRDKNGVTDLTEVETMDDALRRATHDLYLDVTDVMNVLPEPPVLTEVDDPLVAARAWLGWRAVCVQQIDEIVARKRLRRTSTAPAAP